MSTTDPQYLLVKKIKGKWFAVAGCHLGPESCLARAEDAFLAAGYPNQWKVREYRVTWASVRTQKNYGGPLPEYRNLEC